MCQRGNVPTDSKFKNSGILRNTKGFTWWWYDQSALHEPVWQGLKFNGRSFICCTPALVRKPLELHYLFYNRDIGQRIWDAKKISISRCQYQTIRHTASMMLSVTEEENTPIPKYRKNTGVCGPVCHATFHTAIKGRKAPETQCLTCLRVNQILLNCVN